MTDYKKMYALLCRAASDALDKLPESKENTEGKELLRKALLDAEDIYIESVDADES